MGWLFLCGCCWSERKIRKTVDRFCNWYYTETYYNFDNEFGITGQTGTNWDTEMVSIWSLIPVSAWYSVYNIVLKIHVSVVRFREAPPLQTLIEHTFDGCFKITLEHLLFYQNRPEYPRIGPNPRTYAYRFNNYSKMEGGYHRQTGG